MSNHPIDDDLLPMIRKRVRDHLTQSAAFQAMPPEKRVEVAHDTINAIRYIVGGEDGSTRPSSVTISGKTPLARELAGPNEKRPDLAGDTATQRLRDSGGAVAADEGAEALANLVQKVDFVKFVSGLIDGVFNAIVTSSIKQMEAYAELVKNVSKSVEQYMKDNVSVNNARDYLLDRYPSHLELDIEGDKPRLKRRTDADEENMPDFAADLGVEESGDLDDDTIEEKLVPAARRRMAMDRQQLLATMVMMGVNRLVVTQGEIDASVLYELNTKDEVKRKMKQKKTADWASLREHQAGAEGSYGSSGSGFLGFGDDTESKSAWYNKSYARDTTNFNVSTTRSEDSTAKVDLHAKLAGKVNIKFKSDYFPMEKMVDVMQVNRVREKTAAGAKVEGGAAAPVPAPAARV
jgi:hypothetical protein